MHKSEQIKEELWRQALADGHTMRYRALGGSMYPFIKNGNILTIKPGGRAFVGDVIVCEGKNSIVTHRVIHKKSVHGKTLIVTKGDNLKHPDPLVSPWNILGKVVKMENGVREVRMDSFFRRCLNYAIAIASPVFLPIFVSFLRKIRGMIFRHHRLT